IQKASLPRPQVSTDGFKCYPDAMASNFGHRIDYGTIVKRYESEQTGRYSPPTVVSVDQRSEGGVANLKTICTSHVERCNLTIRTFIKRFTRLTIYFSRKLDNLKAAVALHVFHYNFCRVHSSLRTSAMKAKLTDRLWKLEDLFAQAASSTPVLSRRLGLLRRLFSAPSPARCYDRGRKQHPHCGVDGDRQWHTEESSLVRQTISRQDFSKGITTRPGVVSRS
ncbi:MAG TPA: hypothetical protein VM510_01090, partial [Caulifigura sp.]|nr:hypothetical protein [Caulifigura sp.]